MLRPAVAAAMMLTLAQGAFAVTTSHTTPHETYRLANGLQVVILPDTRVPVVTHSVWYNVGAMDEVAGKTGLAHMTEHLMFKGTPKNPAGTMDKLVQRRGGILNAFTSYDFTAYFQKVPTPALAEMMDLEADRMNNLKLTEDEFQPERKVVAEERKLTTEADPADRFFEKVMRRHFSATGYGHPIIGWAEDIQGYTKEDALHWYKTHYAPNNAALVLVGDVSKAQVASMIEQTYGQLPKEQHVPKRERPVEPARTAPLEFVAVDTQVQVPVWHTLYRAPSSFAGVAGAKVQPGEATALWVLAEILGGSDTARLHRALVLEQELADEATSSYDAVRALETTFDISVQPKEGVKLDKILPAVRQVLAELLANGVTEAELQKAKTTILADETYARDDSFTAMYRVGMWLTAGGTMATFDDWRTELANLTVAQVNTVAKKYLVEPGRTTAILAGTPGQLGSLKPNL
ncbi:MAG: insulinase family protein [Alphaproteobacteria bacterium]|nr:insulinase family protein [Alphaproteobacteria bacterium]